MKKLNLPVKDIDITLLDLKHLADITADLAKSVGGAVAALSGVTRLVGVEVSQAGNDYSITEGYLYYNSEYYKVDAWSGTSPDGIQVPLLVSISEDASDEPHPIYEGNQVVGSHVLKTEDKITFTFGNPGGSGVSGYIADFDQISNNPKDDLAAVKASLTNRLFLKGMIVDQYVNASDLAVFLQNFDSSGLGLNEYAGFAMCNGQNNTPDLGGLVTVGHKATDADYNTIAVTGGQKEVTLNTNQMPSHSHSVTDPQHSHGVNDPGHNHSNGAFDRLSKVDSQDTIDSGLDNTNSTGTEPNLLNTATIQSRETGITIQNSATGITVNDEGNGEPHENRQPYMVLYKLMKL